MENAASNAFLGSSLNTLAQSGTNRITRRNYKPLIAVNGNGSDLANSKALKGRAKRKMITQKMVYSLVDIADKKGNLKRKQSYWNTYHCQEKVITSNGKLYSKYCKNRFCTLCSANRKADIINKYLPVIKTWQDPYFVTLTVKAIPAYKLNKWINEGLIRGFKRITAKYRKRSQRGTGIKLMGIKSLECNFNPLRKTYNPHLHIIVPNEKIADILIQEWMNLWKGEKGGYVSIRAQHKRKVENRERDLIEIVKYGSKIFTEPDLNKKSGQNGSQRIYIAALDNIFQAMKGCRIFERFGFDLPKTESKKRKVTLLNEYNELFYDPKVNDWVNSETGEQLSGYEPPVQLGALLNENINVELE